MKHLAHKPTATASHPISWLLVLCGFALWPSASYAQSLTFAFTRGIENPLFELSHVLLIIATGLLLGQAKNLRIQALNVYVSLMVSLSVGFAVAWFYPVPNITPYLLVLTLLITLWVMINIKHIPVVRYIFACVAACMVALDSGWHLYETTTDLFFKNACAVLGTGLSVFAYVVCIRLFIKWFNKREWQNIAIRVLASWIAAVAVISIARELSSEPAWIWVPASAG